MEFGDHGIIGGTTRWPDDDTGYTYAKHKSCRQCGRIIHDRARLCKSCNRKVQQQTARLIKLSREGQ